jgi:hypothetical protein
MSRTHWKQLQNNDWIGAYALTDGQDLTLTIDKAMQEQVTGNNGKREMCLTIHWMERDYKPMIVNRTNAKTITKVTGSPYIEDWHGKQITLYVDTTRLGSDIVECLRIRPYAPKQTKQTATVNTELICADCGKPITDAYGMSAAQVADSTSKKYGRPLCADCATAAAGKAK